MSSLNITLAKQTPIPEKLALDHWSTDWKQLPITPIDASQDPLVPIGPRSDYPQLWTSAVYAGEHSNSPYPGGLPGSLLTIFIRQSTAKRLLAAQQLLPSALRLIVFDGYRPLVVQQALFDQYYSALQQLRPKVRSEKLLQEVQNFVALASDDPQRPATHLTGGSVDLAIVQLTDNKMHMPDYGTPFDRGAKKANLCFYENMLPATISPSDSAARDWRRLLFGVMSAVDMQGFPGEWWHYNAPETQEGAKIAGRQQAYFSVADFGPAQQAFEERRR